MCHSVVAGRLGCLCKGSCLGPKFSLGSPLILIGLFSQHVILAAVLQFFMVIPLESPQLATPGLRSLTTHAHVKSVSLRLHSPLRWYVWIVFFVFGPPAPPPAPFSLLLPRIAKQAKVYLYWGVIARCKTAHMSTLIGVTMQWY